MPEVNSFKRKRVVNLNGNCTPSDSDSDDEENNRRIQRKIFRRLPHNDETGQVILSNENESNDSISSDESRNNQGNSELLYAALQKIQELENELAELDEAGYDSGHQDDEDTDEGNGSDSSENIELHNHREDILNGQAEALGFAFCVKETFEYLAAKGIEQDNPIITSLRNCFLGQCNNQV